MSIPSLPFITAFATLTSTVASAGGSNYVTPPGAIENFRGNVIEWSVPTPKFARDPAIGPDGNIYITVMYADRIARFDTRSKQFNEWELPSSAHPHGLLVDRAGIVWYTGNGNGTIGRLDPATGKVTEYKVPSGGSPHTIVAADDGMLWFSNQNNSVGRLDPNTGAITEVKVSGGPYGIAIDKQGNVWAAGLSGDKLIKVDAKSLKVSELPTGRGSGPRRVATAPDGRVWAVTYGTNRLLEVDPVSMTVARTIDLPNGRDGGGYAVTIDGAGVVFANEINRNSIVRYDPRSGAMQTVTLPGSNAGIRKMIVDGQGRLWYMGSHNGKVGMVE